LQKEPKPTRSKWSSICFGVVKEMTSKPFFFFFFFHALRNSGFDNSNF
jgi:hypothetical protein